MLKGSLAWSEAKRRLSETGPAAAGQLSYSAQLSVDLCARAHVPATAGGCPQRVERGDVRLSISPSPSIELTKVTPVNELRFCGSEQGVDEMDLGNWAAPAQSVCAHGQIADVLEGAHKEPLLILNQRKI